MKRRSGFVLETVGGDTYAVAVTAEAAGVGSMVKLNPTAATLFALLETETDTEALVAALMEKYEVTKEVAERDVAAFVAALGEAKLLD
ncbi:MAG: PqqD family protein [Clostridia bacterium]|nr:PqqD family protein [Clostridia bacterium]